MLIYTVLMFLMAALFVAMGVMIFRGRTDLIHDYHQKKVKDKAAYCKDMGKVLLMFSAGMVVSGAVAMLGEAMALTATLILLLSVGIGLVLLCLVQKKHNGGIF